MLDQNVKRSLEIERDLREKLETQERANEELIKEKNSIYLERDMFKKLFA